MLAGLEPPSSFTSKDPTRTSNMYSAPSAFESVNNMAAVPPQTPATASSYGVQNASAIYLHVHETSAKRLQTLDYLRKAHEGRVYWFNTVHFTRADISRLPYFEKRKLARRAINYLLLGLSLPPILDVSSNPLEYLRSLNALLIEFEAFQQIHSADGGPASTLARARIPQMFKRSTHTGTKARRASSATEIGLPMQSSDQSDLKAMTGNIASSTNAASTASFPSNSDSSDLLPGEEYTYLLTPTLPFDPDFFETFATLCDVLIDCYSRLMTLVSSPLLCTAALGEMFAKADARLRKVIMSSIVREFEDASRSSVKSEVAGVGRAVLGGLLG